MSKGIFYLIDLMQYVGTMGLMYWMGSDTNLIIGVAIAFPFGWLAGNQTGRYTANETTY